ncbi:hypothetical protein ACLB2K_017682 [Fragaria x ananassa]
MRAILMKWFNWVNNLKQKKRIKTLSGNHYRWLSWRKQKPADLATNASKFDLVAFDLVLEHTASINCFSLSGSDPNAVPIRKGFVLSFFALWSSKIGDGSLAKKDWGLWWGRQSRRGREQRIRGSQSPSRGWATVSGAKFLTEVNKGLGSALKMVDREGREKLHQKMGFEF